VQAQADLLEVVGALGAGGCLAHFLDGGHEQGDQDGDDRDHHQEFDQGESLTPLHDGSSRCQTVVGRKTLTQRRHRAIAEWRSGRKRHEDRMKSVPRGRSTVLSVRRRKNECSDGFNGSSNKRRRGRTGWGL
jgi:hypothetical protein